MNGRDLNQFQFDYDQTWAMLFLTPDGTVLARYGSRDSSDGMTLNSMDGLKLTMLRVLEAYEKLPQNGKLYSQKRGPDYEYARPEEIPSETIEKLLARKTEDRAGCIHCHNIYDAKRDVDISRGMYDPRKRWKYPFPDRIGIEVDRLDGTTITGVRSDSPAAQAGVNVGEEITVINGQAIHSLADVQFALHSLPDEAVVKLTSRRGGEEKTRALQLGAGWREGDISWRASMYGMPPRLGLWVQATNDADRERLRIAPGKLALNVRGVFGKEVGKSLINAGLAQSKGRSGFLWWLGSLLLGPVATLLIVVLPPELPLNHKL